MFELEGDLGESSQPPRYTEIDSFDTEAPEVYGMLTDLTAISNSVIFRG